MTAFEATARKEWDKAVAKVGGQCNEHGFDLKLNAALKITWLNTTWHMKCLATTPKQPVKGLIPIAAIRPGGTGR